MEAKNILEFCKFESTGKPQTKFGGQPDWIEESQWPLSADLDQPMRFIGQVNLGDVYAEHEGKVAYIFMTEDDEYVDGTWEPEGGENAIIIQPQGNPSVPVKSLESGPSRDEFGVIVSPKNVDEDNIEGCRVGGIPHFLQGEEYPEPKDQWKFLIQLDSCSLPFEVNFGDAGIAYAFINKSANQGKFLWQCG